MSMLYNSVRVASVLYRQSLRLLPWRFYAEYAEQMALDFDDQLHDAAHQGSPFLVAKTMVRAVGDVFLSSVRERFATPRGELDTAPITRRVSTAIAIARSHESQSRGVSADGRLLIGLATEQQGLAGLALRELGIHADRLRASLAELESSTQRIPTADEPNELGASLSFERQLTSAAECARTFGHNFIGTEHLALSLLSETSGDASRLIERLGVDPSSLRDVLAVRTRELELARPRQFSFLGKGIIVFLLFVATTLLAGVVLSSPSDETRSGSSRNKPEDPQKPSHQPPIREVTIQRKDGKALHGTLFLPESPERAPAILVIPGAGQFDSEAPREVGSGAAAGDALGECLARQGFVVLRSRQGGGATGSAQEPTLEQLADDALLWIDYLQKHERVNPERVGVLGHSAGGLVAMAAAAGSTKVAFLVTTATPIMSIDSIAKDLLDGLLRSAGADESERASVVAGFDNVMSAIAEGKKPEEIRPELVSVLTNVYKRMPQEQRSRSGKSLNELVETGADHQLKTFTSPWFKSLLGRDPARMLAETTCPVLVLYAGKDVKVAADKSSQLAKAALRSRKLDNWDVRTIEDAPHSFEVDPAKAKRESVTFSSQFLDVLSTWLMKR